jgi:putative endonuclease
MADHNDLGMEGEHLAEIHLVKKGFRILERNFRFGKAEIDLIAEDGNFLVAVEVKARKSASRQDYFLAVGRAKINSMVRALEFYMKRHGNEQETRFDFIRVDFGGKEPYIEHIPSFFIP